MINKPRLLRADEIEVRVAHSVGDKKCHLLYIDSRAVTKYLDEWVGWNNWTTEFYPVNNQIVGKMGIWDETKNMWIWKSDVGSESNIESEKGLISDTYKRLLVRFGVTELYSAPDVLLPDDGYGNKGYKVAEINYNENREIIHLVLVNRFGKEVYRWDIGTQQTQTPTPKFSTPVPTPDNLEWTPEQNSGHSSPVQMQPKSNLDKLIEFCATRKSEPNTDKSKLARFYNFYAAKMNEWKGKLDLEQLYLRYN